MSQCDMMLLLVFDDVQGCFLCFLFLSFYYYVVKETKRIRILLFVELYPYDNYDDFVVKIQIEINYKLDFFLEYFLGVLFGYGQ